MVVRNKLIVFVVTGLARGGAERVLLNLTSYFLDTGWNIAIITVLYSEIGYNFDKRIKIIDISNDGRNKKYINVAYWIFRISRLLTDLKPEIVISFSLRINLIMLIANKKNRCKTIISERNDPKHDGRGLILRIMSYILYKKADRIVFQTKYSLNCFNRRIQKKSVVIPNPIKVETIANYNGAHKIVNVARLYKQKNHVLLIDSFCKFLDSNPDYLLHIYGEGPLEKKLKKYVSDKGIEESVVFHGNILKIHENICDAEFFVLSSDYEGMSNALMEAMMMGIPCVTTNVAGTDIIKDGYNGFKIRVGNTLEMIEAMKKASRMTETDRKRIIENGRASALCYEESVILSQWDELINSLLK